MQQYKAIISDIDGTLTSKMTKDDLYPLPSKKVLQAINKAKGKMHFVLATSRSLPYTNYLLDCLLLTSPYIVQNGAIIVDGKTKKILWEKQIYQNDLLRVIEYFLKKKLSFVIDERDKTGITFTKNYVPHNPLNIFVSELTDKQAKEVEHDLSDISTIAMHKVTSWTQTKWGFNITNAEVSKQHAVLEIAKILNISTEEMIGIGDGYNDFPLLMACGFKVAMGNAVTELKAIADYIAPSIDQDGVADVIKKFILV
jgi:HAD superfamily hydrolase (TIGR01484 family)